VFVETVFKATMMRATALNWYNVIRSDIFDGDGGDRRHSIRVSGVQDY
jgi:hypothetical protein